MRRAFGDLDGCAVEDISIRSDAGAEASVIGYGAALRDLIIPSPNGRQRVVLGFERLEDYLAHSPYFGAIAGRYANRIARGRFSLGGRTYHLSINEPPNHLHGGAAGFSKRVWQAAASGRSWVALTLFSPDGDQGYPGNLSATCVYRLIGPTLRIELAAACDAATPVNLCHHSYFNLDGSPDILDHELQIAADFITPADDELIPTGEIRSVAEGGYDFRARRRVRRPGEGGLFRYDVNFVLRRDEAIPSGLEALPLAHAASLTSPASGIALEVWTTEPGLQFYDGHLLDVPAAGLGGARYGAHAGLCLEPQHFPDSPNRPYFPDTVLRPQGVYRQITEYRFMVER